MLGQQLVREGRQIAFVRALEVTHLKRHTAWTLAQNEFKIPFAWAAVFIAQRGWRQLGREGTGFAHASARQLAAVALGPLVAAAISIAAIRSSWMVPAAGLVVGWAALTAPFIAFVSQRRGPVFGCCSILVTFVDHLVMAAGIACGTLAALGLQPGWGRRAAT